MGNCTPESGTCSLQRCTNSSTLSLSSSWRGGEEPEYGSTPLRLGVGRLRKADAHCPQRLLAADRQVRDEQELVAALLHVGLQPVLGAPGLLQHDHGHWGFW